MSNNSNLSKVSTMTFIGMTCALVVSVRNIPDVAATGWTMFFYMLVAVLLFALPITLISGEYAGMFQENGGPELWVTQGLGPKWGFVTSWLIWVQTWPGMVMVSSALAPLVGVVIGNRALGLNSGFTFLATIVIYWGVTLLNLRFDMAKIGGKIGVIFGLYVPLVMMIGMGIAATIKVGMMPGSTLGTFEASKLIPDFTTEKTFQFFAPIMFIFTGIELSSVYITRLNNPVKTYVKAIFIALIFMFFLNVINAFMLANVVPAGHMQLDNIAQSIELYAKILGMPRWTANVFSLLVLIGVIVQLSAWATGPSKTVNASALRGLYPPKLHYWKTNKFEISVPVVITQAVIISLFAGFYLLIPGVNQAFLMLVSATAVIYCLVYVLMAIGIVRLRKTQPNLERQFKVGSYGFLMLTVIVLIATIIISVIMSLKGSGTTTVIAVLAITLIVFIIPLIIDKKRRTSKVDWQAEVNAALGIKAPAANTAATAANTAAPKAPAANAGAKTAAPAQKKDDSAGNK